MPPADSRPRCQVGGLSRVSLSAEEALAARITWATMTEVYREDPLIAAIVAAGVASAEQVDGLFRMASGV
jgi:methenyltetrahydromethanopterin cyclohydrolase